MMKRIGTVLLFLFAFGVGFYWNDHVRRAQTSWGTSAAMEFVANTRNEIVDNGNLTIDEKSKDVFFGKNKWASENQDRVFMFDANGLNGVCVFVPDGNRVDMLFGE